MGLADLSSRILVEFKGDISDLKGKLRELTGEEKKLAAAQLESAEKRNKGLESWSDKLGKAGLALNAVDKISSLLGKSIGDTAKSMFDATASGAAMGATFAGPWGAAIGGAAGALVGLIRHTDEQTEASKRATSAARNHAAALKLIADGETSARSTRRGARQDLEEAGKENTAAALIVADQIKKYGAASEAAYADKLRAKRALEDAEDLRDSLNKAGGNIWLEERKQYRERERAIDDITAARQRAYVTDEEAQRRLDALNGVEEKATKTVKKHTEALYANAQAALAAQGATRRTDTVGPPIGYSNSLGQAAIYGGDEQGLLNKIEGERTSGLTSDWMKRLGEQQSKKSSFLESTFGSLDEFNGYATAFSTLTGAVSAGLDAWIDGSMSAGQAIKKFLADALKGLASQMAVEALKHGAYALGSLAFGDVRGAATHAAAAAAFGLAATGAAVAAKGLGGGGSQPSTGGGAGAGSSAGVSGGGGGSRQGATTNIIIVGDTYSDSKRMQQRRAEQLVALGTQHTSAGGSF